MTWASLVLPLWLSISLHFRWEDTREWKGKDKDRSHHRHDMLLRLLLNTRVLVALPTRDALNLIDNNFIGWKMVSKCRIIFSCFFSIFTCFVDRHLRWCRRSINWTSSIVFVVTFDLGKRCSPFARKRERCIYVKTLQRPIVNLPKEDDT